MNEKESGFATELFLIAQQLELNLRWARNIHSHNPLPSGNFLSTIALAVLNADPDNQEILRPSINQLRQKYPKYDIEERL